MSATYLLPCTCGKQLPIERRQAGENVVCTCGATVQAPTLLRMSDLEVVPEEVDDRPAPSAWNWSHRLILAGAVLVFAAIVLGLLLQTARPIAPADVIDPEHIRATANSFSPVASWSTWEAMKVGLDRRTDERYLTAMLYFRVWGTGVILMAVAGLASLGAGVWRRRQHR